MTKVINDWTRVYTSKSKEHTKTMQFLYKPTYYTRIKKYKTFYELYIRSKFN